MRHGGSTRAGLFRTAEAYGSTDRGRVVTGVVRVTVRPVHAHGLKGG
jgi:hypothetical protein